MFKISAKIDQASLKNALGAVNNLIEKNIRAVIKNEAIPDLINRIMVGYDGLSERMDSLPEDPTNPEHWRSTFEIALRQDLEDTFIVNGRIISIHLGNKEFLGYDASGETNDPTDPSPLQWMVYYIEGLAGDWAFITPEIYERINQGANYQPTWGRFGPMGGFMISREEYESQGWNNVIPFSQVRHPFSGYAPLDIFTEALREFRLRPFVEKAISAAAKGTKL